MHRLDWRLGITAIFTTIACSSQTPSDVTANASSAVQGGASDGSDPYAVGVCGGGPNQCDLICSGALIAPNLVMTARHCVNKTSEAIDCRTSAFSSQLLPTSRYYITTAPSMWQTTRGWHQAKQIITTPGTAVCGNDMALIELVDNVPASEATLVTPVVEYSMTDRTRYSTSVAAIGYGLDSPTDDNSSGDRRIRQQIKLQCIPGDATIDCGSLAGAEITANEFVSGNGTCEGDSGSSAYDQADFTSGSPVSFGVLSRGSQNGNTCVGGIYTRTDAWKDFIVATALQAATDGNYVAPSWTQAALPVTADGGTPTTAPSQGVVGDACLDNTDCVAASCQSQDGQSYICTQACDGSDGSCPGGYVCGSNNYCFVAPPAAASGGRRITTTSCAMAPTDPTKPVPWRSASVGFAMVGWLVTRRRRRNP